MEMDGSDHEDYITTAFFQDSSVNSNDYSTSKADVRDIGPTVADVVIDEDSDVWILVFQAEILRLSGQRTTHHLLTYTHKNQCVTFGARVTEEEHLKRCGATFTEHVLTLELNKA